MTPRVLAGALAAASVTLGGCAWLIGEGAVPQPEPPLRVAVAAQPLTGGALTGAMTYLGVGDRIETAKNLVGRVGRAVNPYGEDTFVFALEATNMLGEPVVVEPSKATLSYGAVTVEARTLDDYRRRWPTWAVTGAEEREDQQAAYQAVLRSLLLDRQVAPHETVAGRLAFPVRTVTEAVTLTLPYTVGRQARSMRLRWTR